MSQKAIATLLKQAMKAHGVYEKNELHGVYDEQWPDWYAGFVIEHGMNSLLAQPVTAADLGRFFDESNQRYKEEYGGRWRLLRPKWQAYTAEDLVASYGEA